MSKQTSILGKIAKELTSQWTVVPGTTKQLDSKVISKTTITCYASKYDDSKVIARVVINNKYVDFTVDHNCTAQPNDRLDPKTIRVMDLTNGEKVITRITGKVL